MATGRLSPGADEPDDRGRNLLGDLLDAAIGIDDDEAPWLRCRQSQELLTQGDVEGAGLTLQAVQGRALARTTRRDPRLGVQQDGQVRQQALGGPQ